jgi:hypothetical protein
MGVLDQDCNLINNYHLVFLGDIVDRGVYGYEIIMLIYALLQINPKNVHITRGNHEEKGINNTGGFKDQLDVQFGTDSDDIFNKINYTMSLQPSALLIQNPINLKYIYLSHGGIPTNFSFDKSVWDQIPGEKYAIYKIDNPIFNISYTFKDYFTTFDIDDNIIINNSELGQNNTIRWNDLAREIHTSEDSKKSYPSIGRGIYVGSDLLKEAQSLGIELFIRGHNDTRYNTKLLPL